MRTDSVKRNWRKAPPLLLLVALALLALVNRHTLRRWLTDNGTLTAATVTPQPSVVAEGAQSIIVRDAAGRKAWECSARRIVVSPDKVYCTATGVSRAVVYRNGRPFLHLKAQQVRLNQQTRDLDAIGMVDASGPDGLTVHTQRAHWTSQAQSLVCPGDIHATLRGLTIATRATVYDARAGKLHCPQPVHVTSKHARFEAADIVADTKTSRIDFNQGVHLAISPP